MGRLAAARACSPGPVFVISCREYNIKLHHRGQAHSEPAQVLRTRRDFRRYGVALAQERLADHGEHRWQAIPDR